jgi:hypothetical protein
MKIRQFDRKIAEAMNMLLENILTREQEEAGLTLWEEEDLVCLRFMGHTLASWYALRIKPARIQIEAEMYMGELGKSTQVVSTSR